MQCVLNNCIEKSNRNDQPSINSHTDFVCLFSDESLENMWYHWVITMPNRTDPYQVAIEAAVTHAEQGDLAIDDVVFDENCVYYDGPYGPSTSPKTTKTTTKTTKTTTKTTKPTTQTTTTPNITPPSGGLSTTAIIVVVFILVIVLVILCGVSLKLLCYSLALGLCFPAGSLV